MTPLPNSDPCLPEPEVSSGRPLQRGPLQAPPPAAAPPPHPAHALPAPPMTAPPLQNMVCSRRLGHQPSELHFIHVISCLVALKAFPWVFVVVPCHWLVIAVVSYISKPARTQTTQLDIVSHTQQDNA